MVNATLLPLYPRVRPGTHCIGGRKGPTASLDRCGKSRPPTGIRSPHRPARSESLYRRRYSGSHKKESQYFCGPRYSWYFSPSLHAARFCCHLELIIIVPAGVGVTPDIGEFLTSVQDYISKYGVLNSALETSQYINAFSHPLYPACSMLLLPDFLHLLHPSLVTFNSPTFRSSPHDLSVSLSSAAPKYHHETWRDRVSRFGRQLYHSYNTSCCPVPLMVVGVTQKDRGVLRSEGFCLRFPSLRLWLMGKGTTGKFVNIYVLYAC